MSFRFRKSIKIAPGVRMNFGMRGASMSLGVPGARLTFGTSGTRVTGGIPGTGLSYTQKLGSGGAGYNAISGSLKNIKIESSQQLRDYIRSGQELFNPVSGRRFSAQQLNVMLNRLEKAEAFERNTKEVETKKEAYERILNISHYAYHASSEKEWQEKLELVPFEPVPFTMHEPNPNKVKEETRQLVFNQNRLPIWDWLLVPAGALVLALIAVSGALKLIALALFLGSVAYYGVRIIEKRKLKRRELEALAQTQGEERYHQLVEERNKALQNHESEMLRLKQEHEKAESKRLDMVKALLRGDLAVMGRVLEDIFGALDLPVETEVSFEIREPSCVFLDVDLPEIEDCIEATEMTVLKSGSLKEKAKPATKQKAEYVRVVTGLAFFLTSLVFDNLPTTKRVIISGYTQRLNKRTGNVEDDYVYSIVLDNARFGKINFSAADPAEAFKNFEVRWRLSASNELGTVEPFRTDEVAVAAE